MKPTKYPIVKIIQILAEANLPGSSVAEICRKYSIGRSTFEKWKQKFNGLSSNEAKRLKVLEDENVSGSVSHVSPTETPLFWAKHLLRHLDFSPAIIALLLPTV